MRFFFCFFLQNSTMIVIIIAVCQSKKKDLVDQTISIVPVTMALISLWRANTAMWLHCKRLYYLNSLFILNLFIILINLFISSALQHQTSRNLPAKRAKKKYFS